uniref:Putative ovule protein n=1 Tax=Solanum chacoense TaxID=4108 RepID=A0A0V0H6H1_SOLCH
MVVLGFVRSFWCRGGSDGKGFGGGVTLCVAGEDSEKWGLGFVSGEKWVLWCLMAESRGMSDGGRFIGGGLRVSELR